MLQIRMEGDPTEAAAFWAWLDQAGVEVAPGTVKARREGFSHAYGTIRMPWWFGGATVPAEPIRVPATVERAALPAGRRRTPRSGRRTR